MFYLLEHTEDGILISEHMTKEELEKEIEDISEQLDSDQEIFFSTDTAQFEREEKLTELLVIEGKVLIPTATKTKWRI